MLVMSGFGVGLMLLCLARSVTANILVYDGETTQIVAEFRDMPARFGIMVTSEGIQAMLHYAESEYACEPLPKHPTALINQSIHWAVLIKRGNCTFYQKVKNAQDANYRIAIVHNNDSDELEPMSEDKHGAPLQITAVFIGLHAGLHLKERYIYGPNNTYFIEVNNDYPFIVDNLLLPFAIVVGLCFFLMLGFMVGVVVKCIRDRRRARRHRLPIVVFACCRYFIEVNNDYPFIVDNLLLPFAIVVGLCFFLMLGFMVVKCIRDRRRARRHRLPYASLKQIPSSKFHKGDPYETCAICLEDYIEGDRLRILPCSHAYHSKCIDPWLTRKRRVCPVCKRKVFAANEPPPSPSDSDSDSDNDTTPLVSGGSRSQPYPTNWGTFTTSRQTNTASAHSVSTGDGDDRSASSVDSFAELMQSTRALRIQRCLDLSRFVEENREALTRGGAGGAGGEEEREDEQGRRVVVIRRVVVVNDAGVVNDPGSVSLPINADVEDHQEVPTTAIAGPSHSENGDEEPTNTAAIKKLWEFWKR
ncbi:E3 ubiquitin-protein ligase RNF167 [Nilaparvata lugens]|uniref:E3 ubiquitin-protein ligase RNF167 n=1 Tax=Nilaparvata lugens TaxID=108931 RepID=UPI00193EA42B|nr:E3 ubiquitin-protein ligase RNF167 [Nilaparvata lugens]